MHPTESHRAPCFPWCTGAPRPVLLSCEDSDQHVLTYNVAPIVDDSGTAEIHFGQVKSITHVVVNDSDNEYLTEHRTRRDSIVEIDGELFLFFHNEYFRVVGNIIREQRGADCNSKNIKRLATSEMD